MSSNNLVDFSTQELMKELERRKAERKEALQMVPIENVDFAQFYAYLKKTFADDTIPDLLDTPIFLFEKVMDLCLKDPAKFWEFWDKEMKRAGFPSGFHKEH